MLNLGNVGASISIASSLYLLVSGLRRWSIMKPPWRCDHACEQLFYLCVDAYSYWVFSRIFHIHEASLLLNGLSGDKELYQSTDVCALYCNFCMRTCGRLEIDSLTVYICFSPIISFLFRPNTESSKWCFKDGNFPVHETQKWQNIKE